MAEKLQLPQKVQAENPVKRIVTVITLLHQQIAYRHQFSRSKDLPFDLLDMSCALPRQGQGGCRLAEALQIHGHEILLLTPLPAS